MMRLDFVPGTMCDQRLWGKLAPLLPDYVEPNYIPLYKARTRAQMQSVIAARTAPQAHIVAFSLGAYLALEHALNHPDRVASLVLICSSARALRPEEKERRQRTMAALEKHTFAGMPPSQLRSFVHPSHMDDKSVTEVIQQMSLDLGKDVMLAQFVASMERDDLAARLDELKCPVLIIGAEEDAMVSADDLRNMAAQSSRAQLDIVQGSGHMIPLEAPEKLAAALTAFYNDAT
ncbi:alpha/beta fold hydrolase [Duganella sp. FT80W]|uniref:Alpha/beta fold hydrolase n=1 Tax=Duganella guangzhouensis TaxID=2666084 RepID=A0A6I2L693_9BURK|nr:alpha/beta hydrolase [Duganella guangzhouensis]MRW93701.1 alpha/beta fold hydrolase [Duganella guangzhouensis]